MLTLNNLAQEREIAKEFRQTKNYLMHKKPSQIEISKQNVHDRL